MTYSTFQCTLLVCLLLPMRLFTRGRPATNCRHTTLTNFGVDNHLLRCPQSFRHTSRAQTFGLPHDYVMLGSNHICILDSQKFFIPYEFRPGPSSQDGTKIEPAFFTELVEYLVAHDLDQVLALEVLEKEPHQLNDLLEDCNGRPWYCSTRSSRDSASTKVTGWMFVEEEGIVTYIGNQAHPQVRSTSFSLTASHATLSSACGSGQPLPIFLLNHSQSVIYVSCHLGVHQPQSTNTSTTLAKFVSSREVDVISTCWPNDRSFDIWM